MLHLLPVLATLIVTVVDPSGGVIPGATVTIVDLNRTATTTIEGVATFESVAPGRYTIQAEFTGFDTGLLRDVPLRRAGERKRVTVTLPLKAVEDSVTVTRDPQAAAADPRGGAFGAALTRAEIDALSDDPAEMMQQLLDIAGGNAVIRVDGFNGSPGAATPAIPPKALIKSIRIERNRFAAEHHSPDFDEIEIVTQPGLGPMRGGGSWRLRDGALSGRNPFAPTKGAERSQTFQANIGGTLVPRRASFSLSAGGTSAFDTPVLNVALPDGGTQAEVLNLRRPADSWTTYDLFDYAVTQNQLLRFAYVANNRTRKNLGVGAYDLPERAYASNADDHELRVQETGPIGKLFGSTRLAVRWSDTGSQSAVEAPTIRVLDAFTSGGAQVSGGRHAREIEFASDVDYARGAHGIRAGLLLEGGRYRSDEASNYLGTYTFPSLAAFAAGQPASYTRRIGDPLITYWNLTAGAYVEDDVRIGKSLTISPGLRYEAQTHIRDVANFSPRVGVTWALLKNGKTTLRATYGFFYDWLSASTYEQALRVNGIRERELTVVSPPYPIDAGSGAANLVPPATRYLLGRDVRLSTTQRFDVGIDQAITPHVRASASYYVDVDHRVPRGRNLNAPVDGVRPDPAFAKVIEVVSDAAFRGQQFQTNLTVNLARRQTVRVSYTLSKQENNSDGPFSVPPGGTLATEWGPASFNRRHRLQASFGSQAIKNLSAMINLAANTGTPYTITTGFDDNGDAIFNDRPAGVGRNTLRMPGQFTVSANLSYSITLDSQSKRDRYRLSWTVNAMNLTNHANDSGFSGVLTSPFFMRPTTVQNPRKVDIGMSFTF